ncbi:DUF6504 family protein [Poriferisphaera sp. WC338]|uniref:DUF6504 family protein n=1 Tax=Poriferisphaera sp. WC338 TaxID=3425129 RepID=UPI003D817497
MEQFISEPITPRAGSFDTRAIARGEPGLPTHFTWRKTEYRVHEVLEVWTTSTVDMGEAYLARHWWRIRTTSMHTMKIYCERQTKHKNPKARWYLYTMTDPEG